MVHRRRQVSSVLVFIAVKSIVCINTHNIFNYVLEFGCGCPVQAVVSTMKPFGAVIAVDY